MTAIRDRLEGQLAEVDWPALRPHAARGGLILVAPGLELLDVATGVAVDAAGRVEAWIEGGQLGKPTQEQCAAWDREPGRGFRVLVVQPYVLAQELPGA